MSSDFKKIKDILEQRDIPFEKYEDSSAKDIIINEVVRLEFDKIGNLVNVNLEIQEE